MSEVVAPFVVTLRIPNRGRLMVDDGRRVSINVSSLILTQTIIMYMILFFLELTVPGGECCI